MKYRKYDLYWAEVKFEYSNEIKKRPVVIINQTTAAIISLKVTSVGRGDTIDEMPITDWKEAGLAKASYIRLSKMIRLIESDMREKIGTLTFKDIKRLDLRIASR